MEHDIIYIKRTQRWVCKCGKAGHNEKSMLTHRTEIQNVLLKDALTPNLSEETIE